jgi:hypothetical protein
MIALNSITRAASSTGGRAKKQIPISSTRWNRIPAVMGFTFTRYGATAKTSRGGKFGGRGLSVMGAPD